MDGDSCWPWVKCFQVLNLPSALQSCAHQAQYVLPKRLTDISNKYSDVPTPHQKVHLNAPQVFFLGLFGLLCRYWHGEDRLWTFLLSFWDSPSPLIHLHLPQRSIWKYRRPCQMWSSFHGFFAETVFWTTLTRNWWIHWIMSAKFAFLLSLVWTSFKFGLYTLEKNPYILWHHFPTQSKDYREEFVANFSNLKFIYI